MTRRFGGDGGHGASGTQAGENAPIERLIGEIRRRIDPSEAVAVGYGRFCPVASL